MTGLVGIPVSFALYYLFEAAWCSRPALRIQAAWLPGSLILLLDGPDSRAAWSSRPYLSPLAAWLPGGSIFLLRSPDSRAVWPSGAA